ncbi:hypothetical protein L9F63_019117, partial [Diploptera punctata]
FVNSSSYSIILVVKLMDSLFPHDAHAYWREEQSLVLFKILMFAGAFCKTNWTISISLTVEIT